VSNNQQHSNTERSNPPADGQPGAVVSFDPATDPAAVTVTAAAATHLGKALAKNAALAVRLGTTESGCNGYMYELSFAEQIDNADHRYEFDDTADGKEPLTVVVSPTDLPLVQGTEIDYVTEGLNSALKFANPNADTHCGCGESFSVSAPEDLANAEPAIASPAADTKDS